MSNNLVSQQFSMSSSDMVHLEAISDQLGSSIQMGLMGQGPNSPPQQMSISNMQMGLMGAGIGDPAAQQMSTSNMQTGLLDSVSSYVGSQMLPISNQQTGQIELQSYNPVRQPFLVPHHPPGEMGIMLNNLGQQQLSSKRKAQTEYIYSSTGPQKYSMPNKRIAQMEHRPWLQQFSAPNKKTLEMQPTSNSPRAQNLPPPGRKTVRLETVPGKSVQQMTPRNQLAPKAQNETFESVRSKMRESLVAALALVSQRQGESSNKDKSSQSEAAGTPGKSEEIPRTASVDAGAVAHVSEEMTPKLPSSDECSAENGEDGQIASEETSADGKTSGATKHDGQESRLSGVFPQGDVSFSDNIFAKDELLQGNGLSWVLDPEAEVGEKKGIQTAETQKSDDDKMDGNEGEQSVQSVEHLALKIEVELFKLFGGVNKKYKEKGRSLLFNLKDRNNPELRERVVSGEIPPDRLCSMTAEELASKELSQWRQAKAEELAQMVVLPDSEVDIRRLVKKTHKGEFQVEVDQVDSGSMEVSVGTSSLSRTRSKTKETRSPAPARTVGKKNEVNASGEKSNQEDQETACTISMPSSESTDLMQGLIVDDELKDADFLPPIVSLDEFMESLDSEPPFDTLPAVAGKATSKLEKDISEVGSEAKSPQQTTKDPVDSAAENPDNTNVSFSKSDVDVKSETMQPVTASKGELVWEGSLQLSISATTSVTAIFKSGEKMPAREWSGFVEIKGRVRLDAFERFLQELPLSRSRAVMVIHFVYKEGSPKSERGSLSEVANSYVVDGRVGFAEPTSGVELYLCPPHAKTLEMLSKILSKDELEALNALDNGLIGVVVWRRAQLTPSISPNSTSHHKHSSKKQHFSSRRHQDKDTNLNVNSSSKRTVHQRPPEDDNEDVPPGFGPGAAKDEDDLPEFNFSSGQLSPQTLGRGQGSVPLRPHSQVPSRGVDQIRELIHKYGQQQAGALSGNWQDKGRVGAAKRPWNDDDDDIPEWQPQVPQPTDLAHNFRAQVANQVDNAPPTLHQQVHHQAILRPSTHLQPQHTVIQGQQQHLQQGSWWVPTSDSRLSQPNGGQYYSTPALGGAQPGIAWRKDVPRSRGF